MSQEERPTFEDIEAAAERMAGSILNTPFVPSQTLSQIAGCELWLKFENLQFVASFKERGALNMLLSLSNAERRKGVIAMSAGNHAQGVAYHAARLGIPATIVMPRGTPRTKVARTLDHGAEVIVDGTGFAAAVAITERLAQERKFTLVHPFDDPRVIAGQGTAALEMLAVEQAFDAFVVPIGGGGLISGMAIVAKAINPDIRIIGVQTEVFPSMKRYRDGEDCDESAGMTIAEGIAVKTPGELTKLIVRDLVDDILLVKEATIERSVALLQSIEKTVVEGAGAAALAAILENPRMFRNQKVAIPLTGGNIDPRMLASVILRDLVRQGQLMKLSVPISDQPGALAALATTLGELGVNIVDVAHDRLALSLNPKGAVLELVIELNDEDHGDQVVGTLEKKGWTPVLSAMSSLLRKWPAHSGAGDQTDRKSTR